MINELKQELKVRMQKTIDALRSELSKIRTGRAHPSLVEHLKVSYYGSDVPLQQLASITVSDARTLLISPFDKNSVQDIERALLVADLGLNPATAGNVIRLPLPPLSEERRKDLIKVVKSEAESARISVRNIRREANSDVKELLKEKMITEDEEHHAEEEIQKITDQFIAEIDTILTHKEHELMEI